MAPLIEENIKRFTSYKFLPSLVLGFLDVANQPCYSDTPFTFWCRVGIHTSVHYALACMPYKKALYVHGTWNLAVCIVNCFISRTLPTMCTFDSVCDDARSRGKRCSYFENVMDIIKVFDASSLAYRVIQNPDMVYSIDEFDNAVDKDEYLDPETPFVSQYEPNMAYRRSSPCKPKVPMSDPSVIYSEVACADFRDDLRIPPQQNAGYYRYWAHNVPMFRPDTSGHNTYFMMINRLAKAPPALLESGIANPSMSTIAELMSVYQDVNTPLGCILTYFDSTLDTTLCSQRNSYVPALNRLIKGDFSSFSTPYQYGVYMIDKPNHVFFERDEGFEQFLNHLPGPKRALMLQMKERDDLNPLEMSSPEVNQTTVSSKTDEVLFKMDWVPRPIHREAPQFSYKVGRIIYGVSENVKKFFWCKRLYLCTKECCFNKVDISPAYHILYLSDLSGKTDLQLSEWFDFVIRHEGWHVAASGDDSLCILNLNYSLYIMEGDVSQCDHSVRKATLAYEWATLYSFGASKEAIRLLMKNASSTLMVEHKLSHTKVYLGRCSERNTGSPDTTVGNTLIVAGLWVSFVNEFRAHHSLNTFSRDPRPYQKYFLKTFGFSMKIKCWITQLDCSSFIPPTILKGWFLHTPDNVFSYSWSPLPSRILKLSKIMTAPRTVFKKTKIPKTKDEDVSIDQAWLCMVSMHRGLEPFVNLPYIDQWRTYIFAQYSLYQYNHSYMPPISCVPIVHESFTEAHRPHAAIDTRHTVCECWKLNFLERYGISDLQLRDFTNTLETLLPMTFMSHPVFTALATVDYY